MENGSERAVSLSTTFVCERSSTHAHAMRILTELLVLSEEKTERSLETMFADTICLRVKMDGIGGLVTD